MYVCLYIRRDFATTRHCWYYTHATYTNAIRGNETNLRRASRRPWRTIKQTCCESAMHVALDRAQTAWIYPCWEEKLPPWRSERLYSFSGLALGGDCFFLTTRIKVWNKPLSRRCCTLCAAAGPESILDMIQHAVDRYSEEEGEEKE